MTIREQQDYLINGSNDICLSPLDRGFAYGDGVFRTLVVDQAVPRHWDLHYAKLLNDCNALGIVCPASTVLKSDIEKLFADNPGQSVAKIIVTRGVGARGYSMPALAQPNRVVLRSAFPELPQDRFEQGVRLHACRLRLGFQPMLAGIKHLNRLENVMARAEWSDNSIADGLLLDAEENAIECTMSNLFARYGETLCTPDLSRCGVAGVTRERILELAPELGYRTEVVDIPYKRLLEADEVLICNSLFSVWQVRELSRQQWPQQPLAARLRVRLQE